MFSLILSVKKFPDPVQLSTKIIRPFWNFLSATIEELLTIKEPTFFQWSLLKNPVDRSESIPCTGIWTLIQLTVVIIVLCKTMRFLKYVQYILIIYFLGLSTKTRWQELTRVVRVCAVGLPSTLRLLRVVPVVKFSGPELYLKIKTYGTLG